MADQSHLPRILDRRRPLVSPPPSSSPPLPQQLTALRNMWQLASVFNFLNVFRSVLNLNLDFTMDELEMALLTPNALLDDLHIALLKAIHPASKAFMIRETWVTGLCKKMNEWWRWIADGQFPLVLHHGEENVMYKKLSPDVRVIILKALCELRLDQDDIRGYIDELLRKGDPISTLRKQKVGEDMRGTVYWYENYLLAGQRLYKELLVSGKKEKHKSKSTPILPPPQWETLATNLEEFEAVKENLCSSRNVFDVSVGNKINQVIIPEIAKLQKKKERALKRQHRQALLLDSHINFEGLATGRSRRERKPVTYTFDDFDKSINDAIKLGTTKQQDSLELSMNQDSETSSASDNQKIDHTSVEYSGEQLNHLHFEQVGDDGQDSRQSGHNVEDAETIESIENDNGQEKGYDVHIVKKKRQLMNGADGDFKHTGINHGYKENECYMRSNEQNASASEVIGEVKVSNKHRGNGQWDNHIQGDESDHGMMDAMHNESDDTDDLETFSADMVKDNCQAGIVDLNFVAVGNGVQNSCSRGQKDSACFLIKAQKVGGE